MVMYSMLLLQSLVMLLQTVMVPTDKCTYSTALVGRIGCDITGVVPWELAVVRPGCKLLIGIHVDMPILIGDPTAMPVGTLIPMGVLP